MSQPTIKSSKTHQEDSGVGDENCEQETVFQLQTDCRMGAILQHALYKREQVTSLMAER